jgi:hypothetical protein
VRHQTPSGLRGQLLCLVYGLPIMLLVLLNLPASILDGHIFRMCYRLGCVLARLCRLYPTEHHGAQVLSRDRGAGLRLTYRTAEGQRSPAIRKRKAARPVRWRRCGNAGPRRQECVGGLGAEATRGNVLPRVKVPTTELASWLRNNAKVTVAAPGNACPDAYWGTPGCRDSLFCPHRHMFRSSPATTQSASVIERPGATPACKQEWERQPQSHFSHARETVRAATESRQECADIMRRVRGEFAQTRAGALRP